MKKVWFEKECPGAVSSVGAPVRLPERRYVCPGAGSQNLGGSVGTSEKLPR